MYNQFNVDELNRMQFIIQEGIASNVISATQTP